MYQIKRDSFKCRHSIIVIEPQWYLSQFNFKKWLLWVHTPPPTPHPLSPPHVPNPLNTSPLVVHALHLSLPLIHGWRHNIIGIMGKKSWRDRAIDGWARHYRRSDRRRRRGDALVCWRSARSKKGCNRSSDWGRQHHGMIVVEGESILSWLLFGECPAVPPPPPTVASPIMPPSVRLG